MLENYFNLSQEIQNDILISASNKLNISEIILEKDLWVCWLLDKLFQLPHKMSFKGGTSLSKAFNLIERFSEDVDITLDYRNFIDPIDFVNTSRSQLNKISDILKNQLKYFAINTALPFIKLQVQEEFSNNKFIINLTDDNESIRFFFFTILNTESSAQTYILDHVLIEFGARNTTEPSEACSITTLLSQALESKLALPSATVNTLSPIRTFWEKATLIHVECNRGRLVQNPERLSRHWYDLAMLANSWVGAAALKNKDILHDVLLHKKAFFNANYANYDDCLIGNFRLIPRAEERNILASDLQKMHQSKMFQNSAPNFAEIINVLIALQDKINTI